jgi:PAS domain S-box-containing protein
MDDIIATDKQIEQILQQITVIPEQVADGIVVIDLAGTIRFFNPAWVAMHGYDATEELIGRHISEFHTEEQMKTLVADFIEETKRRGQLAGPVEHMRKCGTVFCSQTKMTTARDKEGKTIGLVVFATNTTQPAQAQRHLSNQTIELTAANQQLQHQITEHENTENELKEQRDQLEQRLNQQNTELTAVKEQLQDEITERQQIQQRLKQQADELITALATKEQLQSQISEHREAEKSLKQEIDELTSANEQLKHQINEQAQAEDKLKIHNELIEQHIEQQANELKAADRKLEQMLTEQKTKAKANAEKAIANIETEYQQQLAKIKADAEQAVNEHKQTEVYLRQQIAELTAANKKLQNKVTRQKQAEKALKENREQLQQEIARRRQAKEDLTQLQARLNLLLANICKLNQELKLTCLKTGTENQKV